MKTLPVVKVFFLFMLMTAAVASAAEIDTIEQLTQAYGDGACGTCHEKIHGEWTKSMHSRSVVHSLGGMRNFIVFGLERDWKKPVDKENLMRCMHCHAPLLEYASESLVRKIGGMIVSASGGDEAAKKELARLNVNCIVCHNTVAVVEKNLRGLPKKGVYYGTSGSPTQAHGTEKTPALSSPSFCGRCHWLYTPPDGDTLYCNTLYGSYQDSYRAGGGPATCQDCHMRKKGAGHSFPGAYNEEMVREGIQMEVRVDGARMRPGKAVPTAVIAIGLINKAGHRIPDG
ncbi:MAG: hypothetical protein HZB33_14750 [Nitrospirae bacterium]|nr:hypothetical protein [Nitrospirota bacterium]